MKKRLFVVFLIFLILSSITYVEAREVKTLKDLFNSIKEIFITGKATSGPSPNVVGIDEKLPIQDEFGSIVKENVKCNFIHSLSGESLCYADSPEGFSCKGIDSCTITVYGQRNKVLAWKSTCNYGNPGYDYTTINGVDEDVEFTCRNEPPRIIRIPPIPSEINKEQVFYLNFEAEDLDNDILYWFINWGDDEPGISQFCLDPNCFRYSMSKIFFREGYYTNTVSVHDGDGDFDSYSFQIRVIGNQTNTTINGPDLAVTNIEILNQPIVNQETLFSTTIRNIGNRNAYGYGASFEFGGGRGGYGFGTPGILGPGESVYLNASNNYTLEGEYTFSVNVTTSNDTNLRNNFLSRTFRVINQIQNGSIIINESVSKLYSIELGENIAGTFRSNKIPKELDHDILNNLFDGEINFNNKMYHTAELVELGQYDNTSTQTSLAGPFPDDDYQSRMVVVSRRNSIKAYYAFLDQINLNDIRSSNPLTMKFLGKQIKILMIDDANSFVAEVDGITNVYNDLDPFIGEDPEDPRWIWDIGNLNTIGKTTIINEPNAPITLGPGPFIGIELDHNFRDGGDEPAIEKGQCIPLPNRYVYVCFDGLNTGDGYNKDVISEFVENIDLSTDSGVPGYSNANAIQLSINSNNGFKLIKASFNNLTTNLSVDKLTDTIWIVNGSAVFFKDPSYNNRKRFAGSIFGYNLGTQTFAQINTQNPSTSDDKINLRLGDNGLFIALEFSDLDENLTSIWYKEFNRRMVNSLGRTRSSEEADELRWQRGFGYNVPGFNLGTKDEDHRIRYGIIIDEPNSNGARDMVVLSIPQQQIKELISVSVGGTYIASSSIEAQKSKEQQIQPESYKSQEPALQEREQTTKQEQTEKEQQKPKENFLTRLFKEFFEIFQ